MATATVSSADSLKVGSAYRTAQIDTPGTGTAYSIVARDMDGNINAALFQGIATAARYADVAEMYTSDSQYEPGTVVEFGGTDEVTVAEDATIKVAGVVSTNPAHLMNSDLGPVTGKVCVAVALVGRVPCKVRGKIRKGDMLISGGSGFARPASSPAMGSVIGKALQDFDGDEGVIEVVVGRM
jgi:hypothetical protein